MSTATASRFHRDLLTWGDANRRDFIWRRTDDPFVVLVSEILLQRSRGKTVALVASELFRRFPDASALSRARVSSIESVFRPLGLIRRAPLLKALANAILARGSVPDSFDDLVALPAVGPYAANATLAVAFGKRAPVVDGVTARVYRRYFALAADAPASIDAELWRVVEEATPTQEVRQWNWAVLDLASTICLPKVPRCEECPLQGHCAWSVAHR